MGKRVLIYVKMDRDKLILTSRSLKRKDREAFLEKVAYRTYEIIAERIDEAMKKNETFRKNQSSTLESELSSVLRSLYPMYKKELHIFKRTFAACALADGFDDLVDEYSKDRTY